jgi:hypothetical protein
VVPNPCSDLPSSHHMARRSIGVTSVAVALSHQMIVTIASRAVPLRVRYHCNPLTLFSSYVETPYCGRHPSLTNPTHVACTEIISYSSQLPEKHRNHSYAEHPTPLLSRAPLVDSTHALGHTPCPSRVAMYHESMYRPIGLIRCSW